MYVNYACMCVLLCVSQFWSLTAKCSLLSTFQFLLGKRPVWRFFKIKLFYTEEKKQTWFESRYTSKWWLHFLISSIILLSEVNIVALYFSWNESVLFLSRQVKYKLNFGTKEKKSETGLERVNNDHIFAYHLLCCYVRQN